MQSLSESNNQKEVSSHISDWSFESKYDLLGPEEKMLHQVRLIRGDVGSVVYSILSVLAFILLVELNKAVALAVSLAFLSYGYYKHYELRKRLYSRFEHQRAFI